MKKRGILVIKIDKFANIAMFLLSLCLCVPKHNALNSASFILALLIILYGYRKNILCEIKGLPRELKVGFIVFLCSLIIASIGVKDKMSITKAFDYVYYTIPFLLVYFLGNLSTDKKCVLFGFALGMAYMSLYGLYDYVLFDRSRLAGLYKQPNHTGSMLAIMIPVTVCYFLEYYREVTKKNALLCLGVIGSIISGGIALFLTGSRGAILGFIVGFLLTGLIYTFKNFSGKKVLSLLMVVCCISAVSLYGLYSLNGNKFTRSYDNERLLLLKSSYNMWNDHKIFGVGLSNWKEQYQSKYVLSEAKEKHLGTPHNVVAYYFSTTGLIGGMGYVLFSVLILKYILDNMLPINFGGLCCLAIFWAFLAISLHGLVDVGITKKEIYRLFCGVVGLMIYTVKNIKNKRLEQIYKRQKSIE